MFNKLKFKAAVINSGHNLETLAMELGINPSTLHRKMNGDSEFTRKEIRDITRILHLSVNDMNDIFFTDKLTKTQ